MRVLAIDYGDRRTGLAFSDLGGVLCGEAFIVEEWDAQRLAERIAAECRAREVGQLVLGLPKNMDGTEGPRAEKSRAFAEMLRGATGLDVRLWDERRSSVEAHAILSANGKREKKHKKTVDALAAALLRRAISPLKTADIENTKRPAPNRCGPYYKRKPPRHVTWGLYSVIIPSR